METIKGLTHEEVEEKIKQGKSNKVKIKTNESILKILRKNIFTYFNFIFLILTILLITSHSYRNLIIFRYYNNKYFNRNYSTNQVKNHFR